MVLQHGLKLTTRYADFGTSGEVQGNWHEVQRNLQVLLLELGLEVPGKAKL